MNTGHVGINVTNLDRSRDFYSAVFGLRTAGGSDEAPRRFAFLGDGEKLVLTLWEQSEGRFNSGSPGLHHLSFEVATVGEVRAAEERLKARGATFAYDGIVPHREGAPSGGIFFEDPDGTRLEIFTHGGRAALRRAELRVLLMSYHEGELEMQRRAGTRELAGRVARIISPEIPAAAAAFLAAQPFLVVSFDDTASLLSGEPGFAFASSPREVTIRTDFDADGMIGILAIDLATRRRMRVNGTAARRDDSLIVATREVYSNCPQYIHPRPFDGRVTTTRTHVLDAEQRQWIASADTFFLATSHPQHGADASHRGGEPGFVRVDSPTRLSWPDYPGNNMFNSLGNLAVNPRCGLLFVDFANHRALQLRGNAVVEGDEERVVRFALE